MTYSGAEQSGTSYTIKTLHLFRLTYDLILVSPFSCAECRLQTVISMWNMKYLFVA